MSLTLAEKKQYLSANGIDPSSAGSDAEIGALSDADVESYAKQAYSAPTPADTTPVGRVSIPVPGGIQYGYNKSKQPADVPLSTRLKITALGTENSLEAKKIAEAETPGMQWENIGGRLYAKPSPSTVWKPLSPTMKESWDVATAPNREGTPQEQVSQTFSDLGSLVKETGVKALENSPELVSMAAAAATKNPYIAGGIGALLSGAKTLLGKYAAETRPTAPQVSEFVEPAAQVVAPFLPTALKKTLTGKLAGATAEILTGGNLPASTYQALATSPTLAKEVKALSIDPILDAGKTGGQKLLPIVERLSSVLQKGSTGARQEIGEAIGGMRDLLNKLARDPNYGYTPESTALITSEMEKKLAPWKEAAAAGDPEAAKIVDGMTKAFDAMLSRDIQVPGTKVVTSQSALLDSSGVPITNTSVVPTVETRRIRPSALYPDEALLMKQKAVPYAQLNTSIPDIEQPALKHVAGTASNVMATANEIEDAAAKKLGLNAEELQALRDAYEEALRYETSIHKTSGPVDERLKAAADILSPKTNRLVREKIVATFDPSELANIMEDLRKVNALQNLYVAPTPTNMFGVSLKQPINWAIRAGASLGRASTRMSDFYKTPFGKALLNAQIKEADRLTK